LENNNGKVAIVTGASSGIGYATSLALSKAGIRVAIGARRMERLQELEQQIVKNHDEGGRKVEEEEIFIQRKLDVTSKCVIKNALKDSYCYYNKHMYMLKS